MFYVCKKREDNTYGVMDTDDGVVEYYPPKELLKIYSKFHVNIEGITKKEDGKYSIRVLQPTSFKSENEYHVDNDGVAVSNNLGLNGVSVFDNSDAILDSDDYRAIYTKLPVEKILKLAQDTVSDLLYVANHITNGEFDVENITLLDGIDCIGIDTTPLRGGYTFSIYFNGDVEKDRIFARGFGLDIMDSDGRIIDGDYHFDSTFKDWMTDINNFKYRDLLVLA